MIRNKGYNESYFAPYLCRVEENVLDRNPSPVVVSEETNVDCCHVIRGSHSLARPERVPLQLGPNCN